MSLTVVSSVVVTARSVNMVTLHVLFVHHVFFVHVRTILAQLHVHVYMNMQVV